MQLQLLPCPDDVPTVLPTAYSAGPAAWDLHGTLGPDTKVTYQGQPDAGTTSNYFLLMKTGQDFTAIPVAGITFRPTDR